MIAFARIACLLAGVTLIPAALAAQTTRHTLRGDQVSIYNLVGELHVGPAEGGDVTVEVRRGGADAGRLEIATGPLRDTETLRVIYPADVVVVRSLDRPGRRGSFNTTLRVRDDGTFGHGWSRNRRDGRQVRITSRGNDGFEAYADLEVGVPTGKRVALHLGVGMATVSNVDGVISLEVAAADVSADRTRGTLNIETGSGNVDVREVAGDVSLETGSGDIGATSVRAARLNLETGSGNIRLSGVEGTQLDVETGSGDISVTGAKGDQVSLETGSGNVDVTLVSAFQSLAIESGSGNVTLRVPSDIGAEVDLETGSGDIDLGGLSVQVRRLRRDHITGTIGSGGGRLSIETGSGNVRLIRL